MEVSVHIAGEAWCVAFDRAASPAATCLAAAAAAAGVGLASQSTRAGLAKLSSSAKAEQDQDGHYAHSDVQLVPAHGRGSSRVTQVREVKSQWRASEFLGGPEERKKEQTAKYCLEQCITERADLFHLI